MRSARSWIVLGGIVGILAGFGCGAERSTSNAHPSHPSTVPLGVGGGPRATAEPLVASPLDGAWTMTMTGPGLIGHERCPLTIEVEGSHVLGHFHPDQGTIDGTIEGDVIEGSWKELDGEGTFVWTIAPDGRHFTGAFGGMLHSQRVPEGATWSGALVQSSPSSSSSPHR
jgi:hypothetical protein